MSTLSRVTVTDTTPDAITVAITGAQTAESVKAARTAAAGAAHGLVRMVGDPVRTGNGWTVTFAPIPRPVRKPAAPAAPAPVATGKARKAGKAGKAGKADPRVAALSALGLTPEQVAGIAALFGAAPVVAPAPKAPRELPAFLQKTPVTCATCRDLGVVRGVGANAGKPYKTADGAAAAKSAGRAVKCPTHTRARKSA